MNTTQTQFLFSLESGETCQDVLVQIANNLGDCDDAADLAEIVSILDSQESISRAMFEALQALLTASEIVDGCEPTDADIEHLHKCHSNARQALSLATKGNQP